MAQSSFDGVGVFKSPILLKLSRVVPATTCSFFLLAAAGALWLESWSIGGVGDGWAGIEFLRWSG